MYMPQHLSAQVFAAGFLGLTLVPGTWTLATAPVAHLSADVISGQTQRQYEAGFDDSFPLRDAIRQSWTALKFGAFGEMADGAIAGQGDVLFTAEEFTTPQDSRDFATALQAARTQIAAAGAELVPVIVPDKARMMPDALSHGRSVHFEGRYDRLLDTIKKHGLRTVDLRPALSQTQSYMATDTHWSPQGAQAVAAHIATALDGTLFADAPFETVQTGERPFDGDLLAFVDTGAWRSIVGPAVETIATFETLQQGDGGMGLFGAAETPIALVGTSFSARDDFHFVGFLKSSFGADVVSFAMEGRGPFIPMDIFLNDGGLAAANPRIVLWEIPERYLDTWSTHP